MPISTAASDERTTIAFAAASRPTIAAAAEELIEEFLLFDDKQSKTELLMELGEALPDTFAPLKALTTAVPGCMSEVYLIGRPVPDAPDKFEFVADSNAQIVRGLIALLQALFSGQLASDVLSFDIEALFRKIGLDQFVSSQRRSGLDGMIRRIRTLAQAIEDRRHPDEQGIGDTASRLIQVAKHSPDAHALIKRLLKQYSCSRVDAVERLNKEHTYPANTRSVGGCVRG